MEGLDKHYIIKGCRALVSYYIPRLEYRLVSEPYTEVSSVSWMLIAVSIEDLGFQQFTRFILHIGLVYEVESTRDAKWHTVRERTLPEWVDEEDCGCCCNRCRVCNTDPRSHAQAVGKFPFTTHVAEDANEEVKDNELVRTTIVQPLVE